MTPSASPAPLTAAQIGHVAEAAKHTPAEVRTWLAGQPLDTDTAARIARFAWIVCGFRRPPPPQTALNFEA